MAARPHAAQSGSRLARPHARSRLVDWFAHEAKRCATAPALAALLGDAARELGFSYFALLHHCSLRYPSGSRIRIDNYPAGWEQELLSSGLVLHDPVHHASLTTNIGFAWSDLPWMLRLTAPQRRILEDSRRFGIGAGFTVPANIPGEPSGSCSFAVPRGKKMLRNRLLSAELIGAHAFRAARRLHDYPRQGDHPRLSPRELQCLRLVAAGKTDWEIAVILGLSVETAHQYVKSARAAYDAVNRTQLVVHGLRDAQISFDDAIPPDGRID